MHFNMFNCFLLSLFWGLDGPVIIRTELFLLTGHQSQQSSVGHGTRMSRGLGRALSCTPSLAGAGCKVCLQGLEPRFSASVKPKPHARALKMDQGGGGGGVSQDLCLFLSQCGYTEYRRQRMLCETSYLCDWSTRTKSGL